MRTRLRSVWMFRALVRCFAGMVLASAGMVLAQPTRPAATAPATAPATLPATPLAAAQAFAAAIDRGDARGAREVALSDRQTGQWVDATVSLAGALKKLDAAAVARFGEPGRRVTKNLLALTDSLKALGTAQEKIEGESATIVDSGGAVILSLKKAEGRWRVVMPAPEQAERTIKLYRLIESAAQKTMGEISGGAHKTPDAAAQAFARRVFQARVTAG